MINIIGNFIGNYSSGGGEAALAQLIYDNHAARVAADGGVIESEAVCRSVIEHLIKTKGITSEDQFKTKFPATVDPATFGYKAGTGSLSTLGLAASKLYSINEDGDVSQDTAASQPLLLRHNDIDGNYAYFPRSDAGNQSITTSGITWTPASDTLVITVKVLMTAQTANTWDTIVFSGTQWNFQYQNGVVNKTLRFGGSTATVGSTVYTPSTTAPHWVRCTAVPAGITFEWSPNGVDWTTLDTGVTVPTYGSASNIAIGYSNAREQNACNIYYVKVENETTEALDECDINDWDPAVSETSITTGTTVWNGINYASSNTFLKMCLVDRTVVQGDGIGMKLSGTLVTAQPHTIYALIRRGGLGTLSGLAASSSISNDGTNTTLNNGTALSIANTSKLKQFITAESNGASSKIRIDDGADTVGDAGAEDGTYLDLLGNGAAYGNYELFAYIISSESDSDTVKEQMNTFFNG